MRIYFILLVTFFNMTLIAQPGYLGKRNILGIGFNGGIINHSSVAYKSLQPSINIERVISRKFSINFIGMFSFNNVKLQSEYQPFITPFLGGSSSNQYQNVNLCRVEYSNNIKYFLFGYGIELKRYIMIKGGLAPFGPYYSYGIRSQIHEFINSVDAIIIQPDISTNGSLIYHQNSGNIRPIQQTLISFSIGQKRFTRKGLFFDYSLMLSFGPLWSSIDKPITYSMNSLGSLKPGSIENTVQQQSLFLSRTSQFLQLSLKGGYAF